MYVCIVKWDKKRTIPAKLSFNEICHCLYIKICFQAEAIFTNHHSDLFTCYLRSIRRKLLKTYSVYYPIKRGKDLLYFGPYGLTTVCFLYHCPNFLMGKTRKL